uniref:Uncharacterized protein n=1 Tax=Timema tahoe TaxID=61484 RepID=A0A7R9IRH0_9NEOP|nr:unnamed protein product [Timema tahoe]
MICKKVYAFYPPRWRSWLTRQSLSQTTKDGEIEVQPDQLSGDLQRRDNFSQLSVVLYLGLWFIARLIGAFRRERFRVDCPWIHNSPCPLMRMVQEPGSEPLNQRGPGAATPPPPLNLALVKPHPHTILLELNKHDEVRLTPRLRAH